MTGATMRRPGGVAVRSRAERVSGGRLRSRCSCGYPRGLGSVVGGEQPEASELGLG